MANNFEYYSPTRVVFCKETQKRNSFRVTGKNKNYFITGEAPYC